MTWIMYRWVWRLQSPLHIGIGPAGSLACTRLYIPAHALWGALTAELARRRHTPASPQDYRRVGNEIRSKTRLSYLFPAEATENGWRAWLPEISSSEGLVWKREDNNSSESYRRFRNKLLTTRPGTAIDPLTDSAEEGTLRETEVIQPFWGSENQLKPVAFVGYLFVKDENLFSEILEVTELFIGADTRYGLGNLVRIELEENPQDFFGKQVDLDTESPRVGTDTALAHVRVNEPPEAAMVGDWEILQQWDRGVRIEGLCWVPGSRIDSPDDVWFEILGSGLWRKVREEA